VLALASGCGAPELGDVRIGVAGPPLTLDPRFATDAVADRINRLLYRRLVDFDAAFEAVADLATWERLSPRRWRFRLGPSGRRFHDGTDLTAADVQATYQSVLDPATASPHRGSLANIAGVRVIDADTVEFLLEEPDPQFPGRLQIGILPRQKIGSGHDFGRVPLGSGDFRFIRRRTGDRILIERVADAQRFEFVAVPDATVRALKLVRGELDLLTGELPPEIVAWLEQRDEVDILRGEGTTFSYLGFNLEDPLLGRREVRKAIALAIDRAAITALLMRGTARPASTMLPPRHWAAATDLPEIPFDPERARDILHRVRDAPGRALEIRYKTSNNPFRVRLATVLQHQLAQVGIALEVETYDWGTFYGDIKAGAFQMYGLSWVGLKLPDVYRYAFHSASIPPAGANRGRYASAAIDRLIERVEATEERAAQIRLYREIQHRLLADLPYVPLWYEDNVAAVGHNVSGYRIAADGNYDGLASVTRHRRQ
jgi:peptide/nickel transport system substrate-binding protein